MRWMSVRWMSALLLCLPTMPAVADLIPVSEFVKQPEFTIVSLSPDGRYLAVGAPDEGRTNLAILDISDPNALTSTGAFRLPNRESVLRIWWANDERVVFTTARQFGGLAQPLPTGKLYAVSYDGRRKRQLYGVQEGSLVGRSAEIIDLLEDDREHVLISTYASDRPKPMAEKINIYTARTTGVETSPLKNGGLVTDATGAVRFAWGQSDEGHFEFAFREPGEAAWDAFEHGFGEDRVQPLGFTEDGKRMYVSSQQAGRLGVFEINLNTQEARPLITHETVTVDQVLWNADETRIVAATFMDGIPETLILDGDDRVVQLTAQLTRLFPDEQVEVVSFTDDGGRALVRTWSDRQPSTYYLLDLANGELRFLFSSRAWIEAKEMRPMEPISFEARDGLTLHGYLTRPEDNAENRPMVVLIHGGPHGIRDRWGFNREVQLLAHYGYAVLQVNFRGSGGYGRSFEEMGYERWGTTMQDDITDATAWAIEQDIADPDRICLYGGSYGGYATLAGLVREPDLYQCGFAFAGVYDLALMKRVGDIPESEAGRAILERYLGSDRDDLIARSPAENVERINAALFIAHGRRDERVPMAQFRSLTRALDRADIPYETLVFNREGHGIYEQGNRIRFYSALLEFLHQEIGGRDTKTP